jgi:hypothetical protein
MIIFPVSTEIVPPEVFVLLVGWKAIYLVPAHTVTLLEIDPNDAIGAPVNVLLSQMPTFYFGCAKNGSPVAYARAAGLSIEGIECVTELSRIENYSWYVTLHKFKSQVARAQQFNPDMVRYVLWPAEHSVILFYFSHLQPVSNARCEAIQVIDLKGLNASALNKRTLECLKKLIAVNKCFPEV